MYGALHRGELEGLEMELLTSGPHLLDHLAPPGGRFDTPPSPWPRPQTPMRGCWSPCICSTASSAQRLRERRREGGGEKAEEGEMENKSENKKGERGREKKRET